jgi:hypothetical protein
MGVIASRAIKAFIARSRKDYRPWKKYSAERLLALRDKLPIRPPVWNVLRLHQKACLLIGIREKYFGFFLDTGMGKTYLTLALVRYFKKLEAPRRQRFLVLVPNKINKTEWSRQVKKHAKGKLKIIKLVGSSEQKWEKLLAHPDADIVVETYAGLMHMVSKMVKNTRRTGGKRRMKWNESLVRKMADQFDGLVLDESIKVMNKESLFSRITYQLRRRGMEYCFELNGTPFGRDPLPIWGQLYQLDLGKTLGETLGLFRAVFYKESDGVWAKEYKFDKSKRRMLHDFIASRTISYEADEADLPKVVPIIKRISLPTDASTYAMNAKAQIIASKGNYIESKNAFMRMRQISSGWLGYKDDETGDRASINFDPNHKLDFLLSYLDTINPKYKWIVFHEFNYTGALISAALKKEKIKHAWIYGKTKDSESELKRYLSDPSVPGLLLSNSAGAYGLNLQIAKYGIYFEAPVSPIIRYQTRKRFERQESPHKTVFRVDLVVAGTYDESILKFHADGKDLFDAIIRGRFKKEGGLLVPA